MSMTLNLVARLLARGRKLHRLGVHGEAFRILTRLSRLAELPPGVAREIQARLAQLHLNCRNYARARRHLAALLTHEPTNPAYHLLMARATLAGDRPAPERAVEHCRRAVRLDPENPRRLSVFGWLAVRHGCEEEGLAALQQALQLAPNDVRVVDRLVKGLSHLERADEARTVLRAALFRNPRNVRFRRLWQAFQFEQLHLCQQKARRNRAALTDDGPTLLPFLAVTAVRTTAVDGSFVRADGPACLPAPHLPRPARRPDQRHAQ